MGSEMCIRDRFLPSARKLASVRNTPAIYRRNVALTDISVESCSLPGDFHADPADQIVVATARHHRVGLVTLDARIRGYPHVQIAGHD